MNIEVTKDEVIIDKNSDKPHENEYNITQCHFTFDDFIESFQVKRAIFTIVSTGEMYETDIINHTCETPIEVLKHEYETIKLGVYGYNIGEDEELLNRFSPSYAEFVVPTGSYQEGALSPEPITPSQYDLYSQALQEGLQEVDDKLDEVVETVDGKIVEIDEAIENAERLDVDANKVGKITSITITKQDGTEKEVEILDGEDGTSLESIEIKNRDLYVTYGGSESDLGQVAPNIQVGTTTTGSPDMNASVVNVGTDLNPILNFTIPRGKAGSIKFEIVQQLPIQDIQEDTIYLVPYTTITVEELPSTGVVHTIYIVSSTNKRYVYESGQWIEIASDNRYIEYIYVNNQWEELGGINVDVDLSDYYKKEEIYNKTETNTLLNDKVGFTDYASSSKGGVIKAVGSMGYGVSSTGVLQSQIANYSNYESASNYYNISKGTLENVIIGKGLIDNNYLATSSTPGLVYANNNINYGNIAVNRNGMLSLSLTTGNTLQSAIESNTRSIPILSGNFREACGYLDLTTKSYVDGLVGNIQTLLDNLNTGSGV